MSGAASTTPWRVLIADDEPMARQVVRDLLARRSDLTVVGECRTGNEVVAKTEELRPDLLFLDVEMPDLDGLSALRGLRPPSPVTVLVTAYDDYAVRAFDEAALDYLVKPYSDERFALALDRACDRLAERSGSTPRHRIRFLVTVGRRSVPVQAADVAWIEARNYYARLHLAHGYHLIRRSLATLERELDPVRFLRIHRKAIVNLEQIESLRQDRGGARVLLQTGAEIAASERRLPALLDRLGRDRASLHPS